MAMSTWTRDLLLATAETFMHMASVARVNDPNQEYKVFYGNLASICSRLCYCLKPSNEFNEELAQQVLTRLDSLVPSYESPEYFDMSIHLAVLNVQWQRVQKLAHDAQLDFVSQRLRRVPAEDISNIEVALRDCVDGLSEQRHTKHHNDRVPTLGIGQPSYYTGELAGSIFYALLDSEKCSCGPHDFGVKLELGTYRKPPTLTNAQLKKLCRELGATASFNFGLFLSMGQDSKAPSKLREVRVYAMDEISVPVVLAETQETSPRKEGTIDKTNPIEKLCGHQVMGLKLQPLWRLEWKLIGKQLFGVGCRSTDFHIDEGVQTISLSRCLTENREYFCDKTQRILMLIIGYAVLYLHDTPWLQPGWRSANIKFFQTTKRKIPVRPFIETQLTYQDLSGDASGIADLDSIHACPALVSLAAVLMEIHFKIPFEKMAEINDITLIEASGGGVSIIDVELLFNGDEDSGLKGRKSSIPAEFHHLVTAIENCLNCELWELDGDPLEPAVLRSRIYDNVIQPLQHHLTQGWKEIPLDDIDTCARKMNLAEYGHIITDTRQQPQVSVARQRSTPTATMSPPEILSGQRQARFFDDEEGDPKESSKYKTWKADYKAVYKEFIPASSPERVKIAVLDTGIDSENCIFDDIKGKLNCYDRSSPADIPDMHGHGTFVTSLILEYAPDADVYAIKVSDGYSEPNPRIVKDAIDHAAHIWQVDIISMSFGWPSSKSEGFKDLQDSIRRAHNKDILMFAAASNNGVNSGPAYPARDPNVICVHSTDTNGTKSRFSPVGEEYTMNFATVGESVLSAWPEYGMKFVSRSGTSYATPILAGTAAFLLQYARLKLPGKYSNLKTKASMETLLRKCARKDVSEYLYIGLNLISDKGNIFAEGPGNLDCAITQSCEL